jgi:hypothetical protein
MKANRMTRLFGWFKISWNEIGVQQMSMTSSFYWVSILAGLIGLAFNAGLEFDAWQRGASGDLHPFLFFSSVLGVIGLLLSLFAFARGRLNPAVYDEPFLSRGDDTSLPSA